jgi:hypothetical protein
MKLNTLAASFTTVSDISFASVQEMGVGPHKSQCGDPANP